ncbi:hypothetical protein [Candidatus Planktophila versatilis]|uniref:hypothetical protein n=1 Tax=Candidatus Planktophila versatilis TaxID=1884905 RepID=UPI000F7B66DA|nr:hypothetical protein [Candidatus Planktophila versatilis]
MKTQEKRVFGKKLDWTFLIFPIWIPILYILLENLSGENAPLVTFAFIFLIGESHFLATLFFFTEENREYINSKKREFYLIPLVLILVNTLFFSINLKYALILGALMSAYHVTRQSIGLLKLFGGKNSKLEFDIYLFSIFFVGIGFLRTSNQYFESDNFIYKLTTYIWDFLTIVNTPTIMVLVILYLTYRVLRNLDKMSKEAVALYFTGALLYSPYLFASPTTASVIGVSMHWSQYLTLVAGISIHSGKLNYQRLKQQKVALFLGLIVLIFALIAVSDYVRLVREVNLWILIIPLSIQLLHYYYDSLIWRGSEPHLRETVFKQIFQKSRD